MKGAELTTSTIILIILGIIVLVCFILFILNSKGTVDVISAREALRNCCGDRSVYDCKGGTGIPLSSINCKVPGSSNTVTLDVLMAQVGIIDTQLNSFCFCPP